MARYELVEGKSSKFWEIALEGKSFTTKWGRIGTAGQSTTKSFPDEAAAKKEHDKLVAEKVKKGYALVGEPPATPAGNTTGDRHDFHVTNDSGGWSILSAGVVDRVIEDGRANDTKFVEAHEVILLSLVGDDELDVRVLVGGELGEREQEWIARVSCPLQVSGGKLLVGAGFDPDLLADWREEGGDRGGVREVAVPDGKYLVTVYTYLSTMNGRVLRKDAWNENLGAWFRRDHAKKPFPSWIASELVRSPEEDPKHEGQWRKLAESVKAKKLAVETDPLDWVGNLIHLQPFDEAADLSAPGEDGWFASDAGLRRPARCPLGVPSTAVGSEARHNLRDLLPAPAPKDAPPVATVDVIGRVSDRALVPVRGGPVEHAITQLVQVYRLAWLATDSADPEIRIQLPSAYEVPWSEPIECAVRTVHGKLVRVSFATSGAKWEQTKAIRRVQERLGGLPDGTVVELSTAPEPDPKQHRDYGVHRYRGEVQKGVWRIAETYPALDRALLREALDFSIAVDGGKAVPLPDALGDRVLELSKEDASLFRTNPIVLGKGSVGLTTSDPFLLHWPARYVFGLRWSSVWPCWKEPEEDRQAREEASAKLQALAKSVGERLSNAAAAKTPGELVLEGKIGRFERIDLVKERRGEAEIVANTDRQVAALGYQPVGDLVCSRFKDVFVRGYAREGGDSWGLLLTGLLQTTFDFVTRFEKGAALTTTINDGATKDEPAKGVYRSRYPKLGLLKLGKLAEHHAKRVAKLAKELGTPETTTPSLRACAEMIDRGIAQQLGL